MICEHDEILLFPDKIINKDDNIVIEDMDVCLVVCRHCDKEIPNEDVYLYPPNKKYVGIPKGFIEK